MRTPTRKPAPAELLRWCRGLLDAVNSCPSAWSRGTTLLKPRTIGPDAVNRTRC